MGWLDVFWVNSFSLVGDIRCESGVRISPVLNNLFATIRKDYVVRSGHHLAIALLMTTVIIVLILDGVTKVVRLPGHLFKHNKPDKYFPNKS